MIWLKMLGVFVGAAASASLWAMYFRYAGQNKAAAAATVDVLLITVGSAIVLLYVKDWRLLFADLAGSWIGTFMAVRRQKYSQTRNGF